MSVTNEVAEGYVRDIRLANAARADAARKLVDERRAHAALRDALAALSQSWRDQAGRRTGPDAGELSACADQLDEAITHGGQG